MNLKTLAPLKVLFLSISTISQFSCSKDSDLMTDYVLSETQNTLDIKELVLDDTFFISSKASITLDVLANDVFENQDNVVITETSEPEKGTVVINSDNTLTYTPDSNKETTTENLEEKVDTFTYTTDIVNEETTSGTGTIKVISTKSNLLFSSGFEGTTSLQSKNGGYIRITGTDSETGYTWNETLNNLMGSDNNGIHLINDTGNITNELQTVTGHLGEKTTALYQEISYFNNGPTTQSPYQINLIKNDPEEYYIKFWMKLGDLSNIAVPNEDWRMIWQYKSDDFDYQSADDGYRISLFIVRDSSGNLIWRTRADDQNPVYWQQDNKTVPVPMEEWFSFEVYSKVSTGSDGKFWIKINGDEIANQDGPNLGNASDTMAFMMLWQFYGNAEGYQWIDDVEIWDGVPY